MADMLISNLRGMCAYQGRYQDVPCGQTARARAEYCTSCEAAKRLERLGDAETILRDIVNQWEGADWCEDARRFISGGKLGAK